MTETYFRIEGPDANGIYGKLRTGGHRRIVIHVHGLTHNANYYLETTSSEFFEAQGYDHYRMSLYDRATDSRRLSNSTLSTHVRDVESVLAYFRSKYDFLYLTAHSLGGLVALILNPSGIQAMSLWDPSTDVTNFWASGPYLKPMPERHEYQLDYGNIFVIGEAMVEEIKQYPDEQCLALAQKIKTPAQFVIPEESIFQASPQIAPENYQRAFAGPFDLSYLNGGNHTFSNEGNREALFQATLNWFNRYQL